MRSNYLLRAITALTMCLSSPFLVAAQRDGQPKVTLAPCHDHLRLCLREMNSQIGLLRAYVRRLKPGDTVTWKRGGDLFKRVRATAFERPGEPTPA